MYYLYHSLVRPPVILKTMDEVNMYIRLQTMLRPGDTPRVQFVDSITGEWQSLKNQRNW